MADTHPEKVIERQEWLDRPARAVQEGTRSVFEQTGPTGRAIEGILRGDWLGHSLHAAITDLPIGAWTTAVTIDALESVTGREELQAGADAAIGIGLIGAVGAAMTGIADYQSAETTEARRTGAVHALLNVVTLTCFAASYVARKRGERDIGKLWSFTGLALGMAAAKLGGDMVYRYGVNVDRNHERDGMTV
jgi:uncharacterized membrane protein